MKNKPIFFAIYLLASCLIGTVSAQEGDELPFSMIHFVRADKYGVWRTDIVLPNQREFNLSPLSVINFKFILKEKSALP